MPRRLACAIAGLISAIDWARPDGAFRRILTRSPRVALAALALGCQHDPMAADGGVNERWYREQPGESWARPAVLGDIAYFGTGDGQIVARDASTGTPRWQSRAGPDAINGGNLIVRGGVVVVPVLNYTVGLDARTGQQLWRYEAPNDTTGGGGLGGSGRPGQVAFSRIDADDLTVYIPAWGASVSAVDLLTGAARWIWQPGPMSGDTAASGVFRSGSMGVRVSGDMVFATVWHWTVRNGVTSEAWLVALDRITGRELWRVRLPYQGAGVLIEGAPVVYRNLIIVHTLSARTFAVSQVTQQVAWEFTAPAAKISTISGAELYGDVVYVDGGDDHIYALRASDGVLIWKAEFPTHATRDMLVTERRITFTNGGTLFVLDRQTGNRVATVTQPRTDDSFFASAAAFADGFIFVTVAGAAWCFEEP